MKKIHPLGVLSMLLLLSGFVAGTAYADPVGSSSDKSFTQSVKDGYNNLKNSMFSSYSGDHSEDSRAYLDNYRKDLDEYHEALREARDEYRKARLDDQRSYLEHHSTLPMNEDIDYDISRNGSH